MSMSEAVLLLGDSSPLFMEVREYLEDNHLKVQTFADIKSPEGTSKSSNLLGDSGGSVKKLFPKTVGSNTLWGNSDGGLVAIIDLELDLQNKKDMLSSVADKFPNIPIYTSVLHQTVTEIASWLQNPERVVGFSPWMLESMSVLEISAPLQAENKEEWKKNTLFWKGLGKEIILVGDMPGLVFPRTLALIINEAVFTLSEGVASKSDIDLAMKKGTSYPYGPLEWADEIGINQILAVLTGLQREFGEDAYRPAPLLRKLAYAKQGFYRKVMA